MCSTRVWLEDIVIVEKRGLNLEGEEQGLNLKGEEQGLN